MTGEPEGLIFDLDGTLADTAEIGRAALNATIAAFGITPAPEAMAETSTIRNRPTGRTSPK